MIKLLDNYETIYKKLDKSKPLYLSNDTDQKLLRHDVDHSIDLALLLSEYEKKKNISSTYFILHTANYFNNEKTIEKIKKIVDNGHEIGLHINFLEEWFLKNYDIIINLEKVLNHFYKNKIKIRGVSSHGSMFCYTEKFINSWIFSECKYTNEIRNGEDIIEKNDQKFQIHLPKEKILKNRFNNKFKMWSIKLSDYDLYYAHNLNYENYITDSGNSFQRSKDLNNFKSVQINLHPESVLNNIKFNGNNFDVTDLNFFTQNKFKKILNINNLKTNRIIDHFYSKKSKIIIQIKLDKKIKFKINLFELRQKDNYNLISSVIYKEDNITIFYSIKSSPFAYKFDLQSIDMESVQIKNLDIFEI